MNHAGVAGCAPVVLAAVLALALLASLALAVLAASCGGGPRAASFQKCNLEK